MVLQLVLNFLLTCSFFPFDLWAQKDKKVGNFPDNCEVITLELEGLSDRFKSDKKEKSYLIIIGGSSKKAKFRYNSNRISDAIKYLVEFQNIKSEEIVYGTGQSLDELGYLKFYVNGELIEEIKTLGKGRLCFGMGEIFSWKNQ